MNRHHSYVTEASSSCGKAYPQLHISGKIAMSAPFSFAWRQASIPFCRFPIRDPVGRSCKNAIVSLILFSLSLQEIKERGFTDDRCINNGFHMSFLRQFFFLITIFMKFRYYPPPASIALRSPTAYSFSCSSQSAQTFSLDSISSTVMISAPLQRLTMLCQ